MCPFCTAWTSKISGVSRGDAEQGRRIKDTQFFTHVARHMRELSLSALPPVEDEQHLDERDDDNDLSVESEIEIITPSNRWNVAFPTDFDVSAADKLRLPRTKLRKEFRNFKSLPESILTWGDFKDYLDRHEQSAPTFNISALAEAQQAQYEMLEAESKLSTGRKENPSEAMNVIKTWEEIPGHDQSAAAASHGDKSSGRQNSWIMQSIPDYRLALYPISIALPSLTNLGYTKKTWRDFLKKLSRLLKCLISISK